MQVLTIICVCFLLVKAISQLLKENQNKEQDIQSRIIGQILSLILIAICLLSLIHESKQL